MNGGPTERVMIILPAAVGDGATTRRVRSACEPAVRCVSLRYPSPERTLDRGYRFADLLEDLAGQVDENVPGGPIRLTGFSWGGYTAYRLAMRLRERGRDVRFLAILDTPWDIEARTEEARDFQYTAMLMVGRRLGWLLRPATARWILRLPDTSILPGRLRQFLRLQTTTTLFTRFADPTRRRDREVRPTLDVPMFLFRSDAHPPTSTIDLGWASVCPNLQVIRVPGGHSLQDTPEGSSWLNEYREAIDLSEASDEPPAPYDGRYPALSQ